MSASTTQGGHNKTLSGGLMWRPLVSRDVKKGIVKKVIASKVLNRWRTPRDMLTAS